MRDDDKDRTERRARRLAIIFSLVWLVSLVLIGAWMFNLGSFFGAQREKERREASPEAKTHRIEFLETVAKAKELQLKRNEEELQDLKEEIAQQRRMAETSKKQGDLYEDFLKWRAAQGQATESRNATE